MFTGNHLIHSLGNTVSEDHCWKDLFYVNNSTKNIKKNTLWYAQAVRLRFYQNNPQCHWIRKRELQGILCRL